MKVSTPPLEIVQIPAVEDVNVTASVEDELAVSVGEVSKFRVPGLLKVIV
jgi:hypothetical protein